MTPKQAYYKARESGKRIPELEPTIIKNAQCSYCYAEDVIKGRFILGEPVISQDSQCSFWYARDIIKDRWEKAEPAISKDAESSYCYAKYIIKGRLPDFMHNALLLSNDESAKEYIKFISKNPDSPNNKI